MWLDILCCYIFNILLLLILDFALSLLLLQFAVFSMRSSIYQLFYWKCWIDFAFRFLDFFFNELFNSFFLLLSLSFLLDFRFSVEEFIYCICLLCTKKRNTSHFVFICLEFYFFLLIFVFTSFLLLFGQSIWQSITTQ